MTSTTSDKLLKLTLDIQEIVDRPTRAPYIIKNGVSEKLTEMQHVLLNEKRRTPQVNIADAIQCLIDNGIDPDEAETVLQALGYILLDAELFNN